LPAGELADGDTETDGDTDRDADADANGDTDGDAVPTPPVQATPLSAKAAGTGLAALFQLPPKPKFVVAPLPMAEFQPPLETVTFLGRRRRRTGCRRGRRGEPPQQGERHAPRETFTAPATPPRR
jgi:hypothetical protein